LTSLWALAVAAHGVQDVGKSNIPGLGHPAHEGLKVTGSSGGFTWQELKRPETTTAMIRIVDFMGCK